MPSTSELTTQGAINLKTGSKCTVKNKSGLGNCWISDSSIYQKQIQPCPGEAPTLFPKSTVIFWHRVNSRISAYTNQNHSQLHNWRSGKSEILWKKLALESNGVRLKSLHQASNKQLVFFFQLCYWETHSSLELHFCEPPWQEWM